MATYIQNIIFSSEHHLKKDILEHIQGKADDELQNSILWVMNGSRVREDFFKKQQF